MESIVETIAPIIHIYTTITIVSSYSCPTTTSYAFLLLKYLLSLLSPTIESLCFQVEELKLILPFVIHLYFQDFPSFSFSSRACFLAYASLICCGVFASLRSRLVCIASGAWANV